MSTVRQAAVIHRYEAPSYLVNIVRRVDQWSLSQLNRAIADGDAEVIEPSIAGWQPYQAIIRVGGDGLPIDGEPYGDYLVQWAAAR